MNGCPQESAVTFPAARVQFQEYVIVLEPHSSLHQRAAATMRRPAQGLSRSECCHRILTVAPTDRSRFRLAGAAFAAFSFLPAELGRLAGALVGVAFRLAGGDPLQAARAATSLACLCKDDKGLQEPMRSSWSNRNM